MKFTSRRTQISEHNLKPGKKKKKNRFVSGTGLVRVSSETVSPFEGFLQGIPSLSGDGDKYDRLSPVMK